MKRTAIVRVAEWTGWCGPCAAERPLVLTRTGRHTLLSWLTGSGEELRPLTLTCRLCGIGVAVPPEAEDPEVTVDEAAVWPAAALIPAQATPPTLGSALGAAHPTGPIDRLFDSALSEDGPTVVSPVSVLPDDLRVPATGVEPSAPTPADLQAGRQAVGDALSALLRQRAVHEGPVPSVRPTPPLPLQRAAETPPVDGLQALQLLAEGLDLLSPAHR